MNNTVVIDIGHGGRDSGACGKKTYEKNNNLTLGLKVGNILSQHGVIVKYTRTDDRDFCSGLFDVGVDLQNRIAIAKQYNPDVFLSCHNNAFNKQAKGYETHCYKLGGTDEQLARSIQNQLSSVLTNMINRGVKVSNLYVTRRFDKTNTSACLVEYGFIDSEEDLILANMEVASIAIAKGILAFMGIEYHGEEQNQVKIQEVKKVKNLVVVKNSVDEKIGFYMSWKYNAPLVYADSLTQDTIDNCEVIFEVGGAKQIDKSIHISGDDRYSTALKVIEYIKNN